MKVLLTVLFGVAFLGGCTLQNNDFTWYHPQGGEYLFAYDQKACASSVTGLGRPLGTDTTGPFFVCMRERGYSLLVSDRGVIPEERVVFEATGDAVRDSGPLANSD